MHATNVRGLLATYIYILFRKVSPWLIVISFLRKLFNKWHIPSIISHAQTTRNYSHRWRLNKSTGIVTAREQRQCNYMCILKPFAVVSVAIFWPARPFDVRREGRNRMNAIHSYQLRLSPSQERSDWLASLLVRPGVACPATLTMDWIPARARR